MKFIQTNKRNKTNILSYLYAMWFFHSQVVRIIRSNETSSNYSKYQIPRVKTLVRRYYLFSSAPTMALQSPETKCQTKRRRKKSHNFHHHTDSQSYEHSVIGKWVLVIIQLNTIQPSMDHMIQLGSMANVSIS